MFNDWGIDGNTKVITDEEGGLFYSLTDNYAILVNKYSINTSH